MRRGGDDETKIAYLNIHIHGAKFFHVKIALLQTEKLFFFSCYYICESRHAHAEVYKFLGKFEIAEGV